MPPVNDMAYKKLKINGIFQQNSEEIGKKSCNNAEKNLLFQIDRNIFNVFFVLCKRHNRKLESLDVSHFILNCEHFCVSKLTKELGQNSAKCNLEKNLACSLAH